MACWRISMMVLVVWLAGCATVSPTSVEGQAQSVELLRKQVEIANSRIHNPKAAVNMLYAGFALNDESSAFQGDILGFADITNRLSPDSPQLLFSNAQKTGSPSFPFATIPDFVRGGDVLKRLAGDARATTGRVPFILVLLTAHGGDRILSLNRDDKNGSLSAHTISKVLEPLEDYPTLLVISACHAGSHIPALSRDNRIILTASSANRTSFGCQTNSRQTWFVEALVQSFDPDLSLHQWFDSAASLIKAWEKNLGYPASEPQLAVGMDMSKYATTSMRRLFDASTQITSK